MRQFKRDIVGDDGNHVRVIGTPERIKVGIIRKRIARDERGFPVGGSYCRLHTANKQGSRNGFKYGFIFWFHFIYY